MKEKSISWLGINLNLEFHLHDRWSRKTFSVRTAYVVSQPGTITYTYTDTGGAGSGIVAPWDALVLSGEVGFESQLPLSIQTSC